VFKKEEQADEEIRQLFFPDFLNILYNYRCYRRLITAMNNETFNWLDYSPFQSAPWSQSFLKNCYEQLHDPSPETRSYENCYPFIYYLSHGEKYYSLSKNSPLELQPVLLFYGMTQLIKACLLTVDPYYPETTTVLAHGVSTRKRKKRNYEFIYDEIKIQRSGLFNHFSEKMFHVKHLDGEKKAMHQLFKRISEMNPLFSVLYNKPFVHPVTFNQSNNTLVIPLKILDDLHMTLERYLKFLFDNSSVNIREVTDSNESMRIKFEDSVQPLSLEPVLFDYQGSLYLPNERELYQPFPEIMAHYLLLYNLSMICRYETEWWSELFHNYSSNDFPMIKKFLSVTQQKVPVLLLNYLESKKD
jgi:hypothetical protein